MAAKRTPSPKAPPAPKLWPPGAVLAVGTKVVAIGSEVVEITGHLTLDAKTRVHRPVTSATEPVEAYQVRTRGGSERVPLVDGWGYRTLATRDDAERALALLRGTSVTSDADLAARGLRDAKGNILRPTTLTESAELLRALYALAPEDWDVPTSMRAHGFEREVLGEIAILTGTTFDALRGEMRKLHPSLDAWEAGTSKRQAEGSRVLDAMKARKKKPKTTPLP